MILIDKIGLEVEGLWHNSFGGDSDEELDTLQNEVFDIFIDYIQEFKKDGSVKDYYEDDDGNEYIGMELVTKPLTREQVDGFFDRFKEINYLPDDSAGLHIHLSFKDTEYLKKKNMKPHDMFSPHFFKSFMKFIKEKHLNIYNYRASNNYCKGLLDKHSDDYIEYIMQGREGRYWAVNTQAWSRHKTLEIRLLPSMEAKEANRVVNSVLNFIEEYLQSNKHLFKREFSNEFYRLEKTRAETMNSDIILTLENKDRFKNKIIASIINDTTSLIRNEEKYLEKIKKENIEERYDTIKYYLPITL